MAAVNFTGRWQEGANTNKEAFCLACGLSPEMAKQFGAMKAVMEIVHDGDKFHSKETAPDGTVIIDENTQIGVPHTPKVPEGVPAKEYVNNWTEGGTVLRGTCSDPTFPLVSSYKLLENGQMLATSSMGDVVCTVHYTKE